MRRIFLLLLVCTIAVGSHAEVVRTGLKAAMKAHLVSVESRSNGNSYCGRALDMHIVNKTKDPLQITVEPALVFQPADTGYQDLVLPGNEMLALAPGAEGILNVQTFCGKAHNAAPGAQMPYRFKGQGDSTMIRVLQFIRAHNLLDFLGQQAVWALTDFRDLSGVFDSRRPKESNALVALMVKLTGGKTPDYFKQYKLDTTAGQPAFVKKVLKIVAVMDWKLESPQPISLGIYNSVGDLVQGVLEEPEMKRGGYKMNVEFLAEGAPAGKYFMRLKTGDKLLKQIEVVVD